ncbi:MAG: type II toxin-antitoxin system prevent-host-death family antitoxin [Chloroflexi bacterium]|nr:MAG: type II toxin-antitoxin system prevent-host-death family antitoxin [Chloroflexota bacterium]
MNTTTVDVIDAQTRFLELLSRVIAGDEIVVTQEQKPVARLLPVESTLKPRVAGLHAGLGWVSDDFDDPLPDEFWVSDNETPA